MATVPISSRARVTAANRRRLLAGVERAAYKSGGGSPLAKLCGAGVDFGWGEVERSAGDHLLQTSARARRSLRRYLHAKLEWITRPCLELEWESFALAVNSLGLAPGSDHATLERMFLRDRPGYRLCQLFQKFPLLEDLWSLSISQWRNQIDEILGRAAADAQALSRSFFDGRPWKRIEDLRLGLSDPHEGGRSVALVEFDAGRLIHKPRSGASEVAWFSLLESMNRQGFRPPLRIARVLVGERYCWMEYVENASCESEAAVRRFYERLGGIIAAAYLLKGVDCHRQNLIAAGEHPVLVDIDALWQVAPHTETQSFADVLYRTGFFPNPKRKSLQSRSSVLGPATNGAHLARIAGKPVIAADYEREIVRGFKRGWHRLIGTPTRRATFLRKVRRLRGQPRRWIYLATEKYAAIRQASIGPAALRSAAARNALITEACRRKSADHAVVRAEIEALRQLDLPYFVRTTNESMPADPQVAPPELIQAIRDALRWGASGVPKKP